MKRDCYTRPAKPRRVIPKSRPRGGFALPRVAFLPVPVMVDSRTECHVTPQDVAARMAAYLLDELGASGCVSGDVLEPEAGTGALIQALIDAGHPAGRVVAIERHADLYGALQGRFGGAGLAELVQADFLEWCQTTPRRFAGVLMNPPFRQARQHVAAALDLLRSTDTAALVALVPVTFSHPQAETLDILPADTFATAKVYTKIIRIQLTRGF